MTRTTLSAAWTIMALAGAALAQPATYQVRDLGTLGGPFAAAMGVSPTGLAVGVSPRADANWRGLVSAAPGAPQSIDPLPGDAQCWAFAATAVGAVVAYSYNSGDTSVHGLIAQGGNVTSLGDFAPRGIGGLGTAVGYTLAQDPMRGPIHTPATWRPGAGMATLPTLGGTFGLAAGVNDADWIVGWSSPASVTPGSHATLWINGIASDLGTLGGARSQAYAISNARRVAGWGLTPAGTMHAMLLSLDPAGLVTGRLDLGTLDGTTSAAYGVNAQSVVVGTSGTHAFRWDPVGGLKDLNTLIPPGSGWLLEQAWAINDAGVIVGAGQHDGWPRAFILTTACAANCDGSTTAPILNSLDFQCFLARYIAGDPYANCDNSTAAPVLNALDFQCFLARYRAGCP